MFKSRKSNNTTDTTTAVDSSRPVPAPGTYEIDASHSAISLTIRHLVAAKVRGRFTDFSGSIVIGDNSLDSSTSVVIQVASIDTGTSDRDDHLRSADFFDVENYPTAHFAADALNPASDGTYALSGNLTIVGVTCPVVLDLVYGGDVVDPWGNTRAVFNATTQINREDFGLTWNQALETGGVMVGKTAQIDIDVEAIRKDDAS